MITDEQVANAMQKYGGSFVRQLGRLWHLGDPENRAKIKATWPEYWQRYTDAAKHDKECA